MALSIQEDTGTLGLTQPLRKAWLQGETREEFGTKGSLVVGALFLPPSSQQLLAVKSVSHLITMSRFLLFHVGEAFSVRV